MGRLRSVAVAGGASTRRMVTSISVRACWGAPATLPA